MNSARRGALAQRHAHADIDAHQFLARLCALVPLPPSLPSRAPGGTFRHARASPRALDRAKIPRPRAPPLLTGPHRTHPRPQIPASNRLSAGRALSVAL